MKMVTKPSKAMVSETSNNKGHKALIPRVTITLMKKVTKT